MSKINSLALRLKADSFLEKHFSGESIHYRQIISLMLPILVDQAFVLSLSMLNTAMISSSGVYAISAVNMVDSLNNLLLNIVIAVATGGTVIVAQYVGSRNREMASKSTAQAVSLVLLVGFAITLLLIVLRTPILFLLFGGAEEQVMSNAQTYLLGSALSYPAFSLYQACVCCLRGAGKTRASLSLSMITNISYVLLNLLFINFLQMGVVGMSISLNASRGLGAVASILYLVKFDSALGFRIKNALKLDFSIQKKILFIGIPFAMEQIFFNGGKLLTQTFIVELGTLSLTANAITWSLIMILQIPGNTISQTAVTVVGQCMGRRLVEDARRFIKSFLRLSVASMAVFGVIAAPLIPLLSGLFNPPPELLPEIYWTIAVTELFQITVWSSSFLIPASIRAAGDSKYTSVVSLITMWSVRVALGYLLALPLGMGLFGIYLAMCIEWAARGLFFTLRLRGNKWCAYNLIE